MSIVLWRLAPLSILLLFISSASATPHFWSRDNNDYLDGHPWIPAALVTNASRSPCPMLNTLANHGFISRDGRSISKDDFNKAMVDALNFDEDLASGTTNAMVAKLGSPTNTSSSFNLEDFASHDHTEHDASLTRLDVLQGSNSDIVPGLVKLLMDDSDTGYINAPSIGKSRFRRECESQAIGSPKLSSAFTAFAQLEASFIPLVFGTGGTTKNANNRNAPKTPVRVWLNEERFPSDHGYKRPSTVLTKDLQSAVIAGIKFYHDMYESAVEQIAGEITAPPS